MTKEESAAIRVRDALLFMAPNDDAKRIVTKLYSAVEQKGARGGEPYHDVLWSMTFAMYNGLALNEWPWSKK